MTDLTSTEPTEEVHSVGTSELLLSVVMPYHKNSRTLLACIKSFSEQTISCEKYEIILVDDEVQPNARFLLASEGFHHVKVITTGHCGQVSATNQGIEAAGGRFVLLTCADIIASPTLLERHLKLQQSSDKLTCVTGPIEYSEEYSEFPFMRYLLRTGRQFRFPAIHHFDDCGLAPIAPENLYAPNFSIKRAVIQECGAFDERFEYGFQDTDLGIRLSKVNDIAFVFDKAAKTCHDHPTTIVEYARREFLMGKSLHTFRRLHPSVFADDRRLTREATDLRAAPRYFSEFSSYLFQAHEWEDTLKGKPSYQGFRELFRFYDVILDLCRLAGVANNPEVLMEFYGFDLAEAGLIRASSLSINPTLKKN